MAREGETDSRAEPTFSTWIGGSAHAARRLPGADTTGTVSTSDQPGVPEPRNDVPAEYSEPRRARRKGQPLPPITSRVPIIQVDAATGIAHPLPNLVPPTPEVGESQPRVGTGARHAAPPTESTRIREAIAETGSIPVQHLRLDRDVADDADEVEQPVSMAPIATQRVADDVPVLYDGELVTRPAFRVEKSGIEPTPLDYRAARASRLFWLWFATTSSFVSLGVGGVLFALGLSARQLILAVLVGVVLSFVPLGFGTLAAKWSGMPSTVTARATFGVRGGAVPAVLGLIVRVVWGAASVWVAVRIAAPALADGLGISPTAAQVLVPAVLLLVAAVVVVFGYALLARVQLVLAVAAAVVILVLIIVTAPAIASRSALDFPDGSWPAAIGGVVIVFSYVGLAWANASGDLARYQRPASSGGLAMVWAAVGAGVPAFLLIVYGGLLAASRPTAVAVLLHDPSRGLAALGLPAWAAFLVVGGTVIGTQSALVVNAYSGGFALVATGLRVPRWLAAIIALVLVAAVGQGLVLAEPSLSVLLRDVPVTLAVPVAAWTGIFAGEMMIRTRRFAPDALLRLRGIYGDWRWVNLGALVVISAVGFGFTQSSVAWLAWQGWAFRLLAHGGWDVAAWRVTDIGVLVALVLGLLVAIVAGVPAIRRQEAQR